MSKEQASVTGTARDSANGEPVLVITGASTGIGAATAHRAVEFGHRVVLAARSEDRLTTLAEELGGEEKAIAVRCDVTSWDDHQALVETTLDRFGRLDGYFANAGFGAKRGFLEESVEHWRSMIDTNVLGTALSIRSALGHFRKHNAGHFILTSSVAGRRTLPGSLYSATKHAVTAMGEALRAEVADTAIKVTLIEPGMVDTPFFDNRPSGALEADDIARAVMFALTQPPHVDVNEILIRPIHQPT
jgi:NADP-dependent 3-hydroxy acid dehydrogenase YdfG